MLRHAIMRCQTHYVLYVVHYIEVIDCCNCFTELLSVDNWYAILSYTIRYDTIESLTWTRKLSIQLYLAHAARKQTKTNNASDPLIQYRLRSVKSV